MDLDKFLNLVATIIGTLGAIYVMLGILAMTPELIEEQSNSYWDFSVPQIKSLTQQKADNVAGFVFVIVAFLLAGTAIVLVPEGIRIFESKAPALAVAAVIAGSLFLTLHFISAGVYRHQKLAVGKIITARYLESVFKQGKLTPSDKDSLPVYARELLDLNVPATETADALLQRTAKVVGVSIPEAFQYSDSKPKE